MNKKGNLLSIWWFFILAIVGAGIVAGALIFYGTNIDVKKLETDILSDRILNCVVNQGEISSNFILRNSDYIFSNCGLAKELLTTKGVYMIKIDLTNSSGNSLNHIAYGENMEKDCNIRESILSASKYPYCSTKEFQFSDSKGNPVKLRIVTGSKYEKGDLYATAS